MYELKVALKYLLPKRKQLSVSIISIISTLVIALVVWLILVFFSVTNGLEKIWVNKMVALTSPIRVTPTHNYYSSYYHRIDSYSSDSDYQTKSLSDKLSSESLDPYNPEKDEALPPNFPQDLKIDLAKEVKKAIETLPGLALSDFELTAANLKLTLVRGEMQSALSQSIYIANYDPQNEAFQKVLIDKIDKLAPKGILAPKGFKDAGVKIGDKGVLSFYAPSASSIQEQRLPIVVQGFYDPGIIPVGGKLILVNRDIIKVIRAGQHQEEAEGMEGFHIRFNDLSKVDTYKNQIESSLNALGLGPYFKVESYKEFDFTKDLIQQLHSEKNIFSLIATVIIIVACSNIISMLIILVNDKRTEIGILRSMGASSISISAIFGLCGVIMGLIGSLIGIGAAILTLHNIDALISLISQFQGHQAFNPMFFGNEIPHEVSGEALRFVIIATIIISTVSGLIPAYKASKLKPAEILRS